MNKKVAGLLSFIALFNNAFADSQKDTTNDKKIVVEESKVKAPQITLNANTIINAYFPVNPSDKSNGRYGSPHFATDISSIYLTATGTMVSGIDYKMRLRIQSIADVGDYIYENYIELRTPYGVVVFGGAPGNENTQVDTPMSKVMGGTGMQAFPNAFNLATGVFRGDDPVGTTGTMSNKVVLYTRDLALFGNYVLNLGIGYTPNTVAFGNSSMNRSNSYNIVAPGDNRGIYASKKCAPYGRDNLAYSFRLRGALGSLGTQLSGAYIHDHSDYYDASTRALTPVRDTNAYQLGLVLDYQAFQFGLGWLDNGRSRLPKDGSMTISGVSLGNMYQGNSGKAWSTAASYTMGDQKFSIGYQGTGRKSDATSKCRSNVYGVTYDKNIAEGLSGYIEYNYINSKTNYAVQSVTQNVFNAVESTNKTAVGNSKGSIIITGLKFNI